MGYLTTHEAAEKRKSRFRRSQCVATHTLAIICATVVAQANHNFNPSFVQLEGTYDEFSARRW
jgi:hypothetical protein